MDDNAEPGLAVGFLIEADYSTLLRLQEVMGSTEMQVMRDAANIERATSGMVKPGATMQITAFGAAATREMRSVARETASAEKSGEALARQLTRQAETFGKTASEIRNMRAEQRALAAESKGLTELATRIRALNTEMNRLEAASLKGAAGVKAGGSAMGALAPQAQDMATQISMGANIFSVLAIQGGQAASQMIYFGGTAGKVATFMMGPWGLAIQAALFVLGALTKGMLENSSAAKTAELAADNLGSAQSVMGKMFDLTTGKIKNQNEALRFNIQLTAINLRAQALADEKAAQDAERAAGQRSWSGWFTAKRPGSLMESHDTVARRKLQGVMQGTLDPSDVAKWAERADFSGVNMTAQDYLNALAKVVSVRDARTTAGKIEKSLADGKLDSAFINESRARADAKPKVDRHAESLARDAEAVEAQVTNLYALAEAYGKSGAAALIAEARVKAESDAIKKRGDIEATVDRQIQVAIAQRVSDAARSAAGMRQQADIQEEANRLVAAGNMTNERAADLVKDQLADLPLLQAAQAAQQRGLTDEAAKATAALAEQQAQRERLRRAEVAGQFNRDMAAGDKQLETLRAELALVGATNRERAIELAGVRALQEARAKAYDPEQTAQYVKRARDVAAATQDVAAAQQDWNDGLTFAADRLDLIAGNVQRAAQAMSDAFGRAGGAIGNLASVYADYQAQRERLDNEHQKKLREFEGNEAATARERELHSLRTANSQIALYGSMASAAKNLFREHSTGYRAMAAAEKAFALVQLANTAVNVAAGASKMFAMLGPFAFPAVAAMIGVMAALGFSGGGGSSKAPPQTNEGRGTVLGDSGAKSESIKNAINQLREIDTTMLSYSRQMANSLRTIENNIEGFASVLVRNADSINASAGVKEGFKSNAGTTLAGLGFLLGGPIGAGIGALLTKIPIVGDILKGLFGTKTTILGSGISGGSQSLGSILAGGYDAQYYTDIQKKRKFLGITTSNKTSTQYTNADPVLENQFTLILREFNNAILAAAGPLGVATNEIQQRLNSFVFSIGKIDLRGLTGEQIEERLSAVFGAAADRMATTAFPMIAQFQKAGEGAFETLVRVASTLEAVSASLDMLGQGAQQMSIAAKLGLADQFDSVSDLTSAVDSYFQSFYTKEEQAAARTAQMGKVFESLGLAMPTTLAGFRQLVEAQNLNTAAGQEVYATLLKLAPAFADLQSAMDGAKSAADIASERADLQRQLLELQGDTAALRALQLAKLDASNRALQEQIWALQDAQAAAKAAQDLADAWKSAGDSIMDEVRRIRGLTDTGGGNTFAALMGQFNAATSAARGGDIDAAKSLPQLSQALLAAAQDAATSRQELDRIRAQTAASLEATYGLIGRLSGSAPGTGTSNLSLLNAAATSQPATAAINDNGANSTSASVDELREETARLRAEMSSALAAIAANTGSMKRTLDNVTSDSGGNAVTVEIATERAA